jgi:hypothetical protein
LGAFYAAGPAFGLGALQRDEATGDQNKDLSKQEDKDETGAGVEPITSVSGEGPSHLLTAYSNGNTLRLQGRTDATFDGGSFSTENVTATQATGCKNCSGSPCVHVTGTLVTTYSVTTQVTLPPVPSNLTPCQQQRVRDAINNVLAPHEQQHVAAFNTYNGTTSRSFDLTLCRSNFDSTIRSMFEAEERARRSAAQAASDSLDPFHFDVDLNCEDRPDAGRR